MHKILYLPLDERPCNFLYPQMIARLQPDLLLIVPPQDLLGNKKAAANLEGIWSWLEQNIADCAIAILSIEMLVYGGLLPSRLHQATEEQLRDRLKRLVPLKASVPELKILASNLIMRTPRYSSSEEEPEYYEEFGADLFRWGWLMDRANREGLSEAEQAEWQTLHTTIPTGYLADYRQRRSLNLVINQGAIALVQAGVIDFLAIPQDDCAPYGFTARDQQQIGQLIRTERLQNRVHLYPGADEVGCTLLARAYSELTQISPRIYPFFPVTNAAQIIPLYEDRPLGVSVQSHILAAGAQLADIPANADFILALNTPGQIMQEAWEQAHKDMTYHRYRNLCVLIHQLQAFLTQKMPIALADVAFTNGGETELIHLLDDAQILDQLLAYGGWNTCCNTIGSVLATAILGWQSSNYAIIIENLIYHLLEDWLYQSIIRQDLVQDYLPTLGASYYDFRGQTGAINQEMARRLREQWQQELRHTFQDWKITELQVFSPWQRLFEIGLQLQVCHHPQPDAI